MSENFFDSLAIMSETNKLLDATICVEFHPTNPPRPIGFTIVNKDTRKLVAVLTESQVKIALAEFEAMRSAHDGNG